LLAELAHEAAGTSVEDTDAMVVVISNRNLEEEHEEVEEHEEMERAFGQV
jgi:hypothetical protein